MAERPSVDSRERWLEALGTQDPELLGRRLRWDGVVAGSTFDPLLLGAPDQLQHADISLVQRWLAAAEPIDEPGHERHHAAVPFAELWEPVAAGALAELQSRLPPTIARAYRGDLAGTRDDSRLGRDLVGELIGRLAALGTPTLWKEFNRHRTPETVVLAHVTSDRAGRGGGPDARVYRAFVDELRSDGLVSILRGYPVLGRHLATVIRHWLRSTVELLTRVHGDRGLLTEYFGLPPGARLRSAHLGLSDPHHGGRSVALLRFSADEQSGEWVLVYKPKDLDLERAYQSLVAELPAAGPRDEPLSSVPVLVRDGYGYMAYVNHETCRTEDELARFYRNAGRLTALLHLIGCTDCHYENLIARGSELILVDAETVFEGVPAEHRTGAAARPRTNDLEAQIAGSVLRLGLLPQWEFVGDRRTPRDVSALGVAPPPRPTRPSAGWLALNTDGMVATREEVPAAVPASLPVGVGSHNRLADFVDEFCDGFSGQLAAIARDKERWLADDGPLTAFLPYRRRFVARPTWVYVWLLKQMVEPSSLASERAQRLVLEHMARSYLVSVTKPANWPQFASEVRQLERLDVPYFEQDVDGTCLRLPDGSSIDGYFEVSGYGNAQARLRSLDQRTIEFQATLIRGVVEAKELRTPHSPQQAGEARVGAAPPAPLPDEERLEEATVIGRRLLATAVSDDSGNVEWLGTDVAEDLQRLRYGALGPSLYSGRLGIALFLAALAGVDGSAADRCRGAARGACSAWLSSVRSNDVHQRSMWWRDQPLGLAGAGGALLGLLRLRDVLPGLRDEATTVLDALLTACPLPRLRSDDALDMMLGCSGLIGPLLRIGTPAATELATLAGDVLVDRQESTGGWVVRALSPVALVGFSHGASGMLAALARLNAATGDAKYAEAVVRALDYERSRFDPGQENWPDFRGVDSAGVPRYLSSWCHGAPGVALARLCLLETPLAGRVRPEELDIALRTTIALPGAGDSLCCGRFGRASILRLAGRRLDNPIHLEAAAALEAHAVAERRARGNYSVGDALGLFNGASGIGLAMLDALSASAGTSSWDLLAGGLAEAPA